MTQSSRTQPNSEKIASRPHARVRTLAQSRADLERQIRQAIRSDPRMALTDPEQVSQRMKALRKRTGLAQYKVAAAIDEPPRTFQSWENAEVETDRAKYEKVARFYSKKLGERITANWILFGQDEAPAVTAPSPNGSGPVHAPELQERLDEMDRKLDEIIEILKGGEPAADDEGPTAPLPGHEDDDEAPGQQRQARGRTRTPRRAR